MLGYWNDPAASRAAIDDARWMHTGDLATMDADGLRQDRRAHQGHDHPRRREHLPARDRGVPVHAPDVSDVQVIGVPCETYGEQVMAWVKLKEGRTAPARTSPPSAAARSRPSRSRATGSSPTPSR
jgi:fatty-acyl-CoA synthase